jgi:hypothetical protein
MRSRHLRHPVDLREGLRLTGVPGLVSQAGERSGRKGCERPSPREPSASARPAAFRVLYPLSRGAARVGGGRVLLRRCGIRALCGTCS